MVCAEQLKYCILTCGGSTIYLHAPEKGHVNKLMHCALPTNSNTNITKLNSFAPKRREQEFLFHAYTSSKPVEGIGGAHYATMAEINTFRVAHLGHKSDFTDHYGDTWQGYILFNKIVETAPNAWDIMVSWVGQVNKI